MSCGSTGSTGLRRAQVSRSPQGCFGLSGAILVANLVPNLVAWLRLCYARSSALASHLKRSFRLRLPRAIDPGKSMKLGRTSGIRVGLYLIVVSVSAVHGERVFERDRGAEVAYLGKERQSADGFGAELRRGWQNLDALKFEDAGENFTIVLKAEEPGDRDRLQALYGLALCHKYKHPGPDTDLSRAYFERIVSEYPSNSVAAWSLMELGMLEDLESVEGRRRARSYYEKVLDAYPDSVAVHEVVLRLADTFLRFELDAALIERGLAVLEDHIHRHPNNPLVGSMHYRLAYFYYACLQDYERSLPHAVRVGELRMEDPFRRPADNWQTAMNFLRLGQVREALPWFERIVRENPQSRQVLSARRMISAIENNIEGRNRSASREQKSE